MKMTYVHLSMFQSNLIFFIWISILILKKKKISICMNLNLIRYDMQFSPRVARGTLLDPLTFSYMYLYPYTQITSQIFFNDCTQALITRFLLDVMTFIYYFLPKFSAMLKFQLQNNSRESTKTIFFISWNFSFFI